MIPYWTYRGSAKILLSHHFYAVQNLLSRNAQEITVRRGGANWKCFGPLRNVKIMQHRFTWQWYRKCTRTWCSIQKIVSSHPTIDGRSSNRIENKSRWNKAYVLIRCVHQWHPTKCIFEKKEKKTYVVFWDGATSHYKYLGLYITLKILLETNSAFSHGITA